MSWKVLTFSIGMFFLCVFVCVSPTLSLQMCNDPLLGFKKDHYATFSRTNIQVEVRKLSSGLIKLLRRFNWTQVAILYENRTNYIRMKDGVVEEFKKNGINILLERTLLDDKCYSRLINNRICEQSHVKNVTTYMQDMFTGLKEKARSKLQSCY